MSTPAGSNSNSPTAKHAIRVLVVDDNVLFREGLVALLKHFDDMVGLGCGRAVVGRDGHNVHGAQVPDHAWFDNGGFDDGRADQHVVWSDPRRHLVGRIEAVLECQDAAGFGSELHGGRQGAGTRLADGLSNHWHVLR